MLYLLFSFFIIGEEWKCVSHDRFRNLSKSTCLRKLSEGGALKAESFKLERLSQTFHTGATWLSTFQPLLELFTPCPLPFMIMAAAIHSLAYPRTKFACMTRRSWGTCAQKWTSSSNLSEVCSGSDACDNNMGSLTKWDRNPAQNIC